MDQKQKLDAHIGGGSFPGGTWTVDYKAGSLVVGVAYGSQYVTGSLSLSVSSIAGLEELKKLIPNAILDDVITLVEGALQA